MMSTGSRRSALPVLLIAEFISTSGTRMSQIAVPWLVLQQTGSPVLTGLVGTAEIAPYVVLQLLGAPLVDRFGGRRIAILGDLAAALAMGTIGFLGVGGTERLAIVLALVFVAGLARGPADAATQVMLPSVAALSGSSLSRAAAIYEGSSRLAQVLGAAGGGVLIAAIGAPRVVLIDTVTFAAAAGLLLLIPSSVGHTREPDDGKGSASYPRQLADGLRFLWRHRLIRAITGMVFFTNFADSAVSGLLILLWAERNAFGAAGVGFVSGAVAIGSVAGAFLQATRGSGGSRRRTFAVAFLVAGAPRLIVLALPLPLSVVVVVWVLAGLGAGAVNPILAAAEYETIPRALQARVLAAIGAIAWSGIPFGPIVAAALVALLGFVPTILLIALLYLVVTVSPFVHASWATLDARPDEPS